MNDDPSKPQKAASPCTLELLPGYTEAPKQLGKAQASAMTVRAFEKAAEPVSVSVFGNVATGNPRSFTSGNRGWYMGGKIPIKVGTKVLWAQLGLNLTIVGSKTWK